MLLTNKYALIGAGVAGLVAIYLAKKTVDAVPKALEAVNPFNYDNVINQGATSLYQWATGSNGTIGTDLYDATHGGSLDPTSGNNVISRTYEGVYQWATGSQGSIGTDIYDFFH